MGMRRGQEGVLGTLSSLSLTESTLVPLLLTQGGRTYDDLGLEVSEAERLLCRTGLEATCRAATPHPLSSPRLPAKVPAPPESVPSCSTWDETLRTYDRESRPKCPGRPRGQRAGPLS